MSHPSELPPWQREGREPTSVQTIAVGSLVLMAVLWGSTFFSIKALVTRIPVADMLAERFTLAALVLGVVLWRSWRMSAATLRQGVVLGLLFGASQLLQTFGIGLTSASTSGFVTGLYVVFTPLLAGLLLKDRVPPATWLGVVLATAGLAVLSLNFAGGLPIGAGELLVLASAVGYAGHIVAAGRFATPSNALSLTLVQVVVQAAVCWVAAIPGGVTLPASAADWGWLAYLAVLAGALTLVLQVWAQAHVEPTRAAVIMATEPVWAAVFAVALGGEHVTWRMLLGGLAILAAMALVIVVPALRRRPERA